MQPSTYYDEHFGFVWSCLRRLGVAAPDLEDATHDVFVVVHRRRAEVARADSARAWLWGAVRRVASNYRRSSFRHKRRMAAMRAVATSEVLPQRELERADATRLVTRFLDGLAEPQRDVFVLIELQQMTAREVAEVLQINPNTAAARLRAARKAFQDFAARVREENPFDPADALARARADDPPSREAKARVGSAVAATLSASPGTAIGPAALTAWAKGAAVSVALAATTLGAVAIVGAQVKTTTTPAVQRAADDGASASRPSAEARAPIEPASRVETPDPFVPAVTARASADGPRSARSGSRPDRTVALPPAAPPETPQAAEAAAADLAAHNEWLARARAALARGDHEETMRVCAEYREAHPTGPFVAEIRLLEIRARCAKGDVHEARALARTLAADHPRSPHAALADRTCAGSITKSDAAGD